MSKDHSIDRVRQHRGVTLPTFFYGTAWKEEQTEKLVKEALKAGFRGIDTANQRKHYFEAGVGAAIQQFLANGHTREELFLQTKFTFLAGQDHRLPYDPDADYSTQVKQSFASSLEHLGTDYLDSYVLHGPSSRSGLTEADWHVWKAMEELHKSAQTKLLGVSNINAEQLQTLLAQAEIKPAFVQNRCYAARGWDASVRKLCHKHDIQYQGFSLLTANRHELNHPSMHALAQKKDVDMALLVFAFALHIGMLPLTGTSNSNHMKQDLAAYDIPLSTEELKFIEHIAL